MRRVEARGFGGVDVLEWREVAVPRPSEGEVLIDVVAVPVLHLDTQIRSGWGKQFGITPPYVPGTGYVGRVAEAGPGADPSWAGRMVAWTPGPRGGYAERAVAEADRLTPVPDGVGPAEAAALLHDGRTALGLASELGAHVTVDYSDPDWRANARAAADGADSFDVVFDGVGGELGTAAFDLVAPGGRFSAHGAPSGGFAAVDADVARRRGVTLTGIEAAQYSPADIRRLTAAAYESTVGGALRTVIGQSFPLARAAEAHRAIEARQVVGKTVLLTDTP